MICGAPPIATDCPSGPADVLSGGAGLLVPMNAPQAFADAMLSVIEDDAMYEALRKNARLKAGQYSIGTVVRQWLSLLAEAGA
jgi:glycosyltransferase involved in cell wall biosynthesis